MADIELQQANCFPRDMFPPILTPHHANGHVLQNPGVSYSQSGHASSANTHLSTFFLQVLPVVPNSQFDGHLEDMPQLVGHVAQGRAHDHHDINVADHGMVGHHRVSNFHLSTSFSPLILGK